MPQPGVRALWHSYENAYNSHMVQMKLIIPPTWDELMSDPIYAGWVRRVPKLPENVAHGEPWMIVARRRSEAPGTTWALKNMPVYADAYHRARRLLKSDEFEDVAIISKRMLFRPPIGFSWNTNRFSWCGRCRRPSVFQHSWKHFALKGAAVFAEINTERCHYCGAREVFAGRMKPRRRARGVAA
jgi:hypothetical protein